MVTEKLKIQPFVHPDTSWLLKIKGHPPCGYGWVITGTLSFRAKYLDIQNDKVKDLFAKLSWYMNGEYNWKNVPVYWKWELDKNERVHCHFVLLDATPEFHYLRGVENSFKNANELAQWLKNTWNIHGISHYRSYENEGWLKYITKPNPIMNSCFSPAIAYLKRQILNRELADANAIEIKGVA